MTVYDNNSSVHYLNVPYRLQLSIAKRTFQDDNSFANPDHPSMPACYKRTILDDNSLNDPNHPDGLTCCKSLMTR